MTNNALQKTKDRSKAVTYDVLHRILPKDWQDILHCEMDSRDGVGIAAPQIGWKYRIISVRGIVMINPQIIEHSSDWEWSLEGCLSLPDSPMMSVKRYYAVLVRYTVPTPPRQGKPTIGRTVEKVFYGSDAFIVQHEIDHLNGIHYTDRAAMAGLPLYK